MSHRPRRRFGQHFLRDPSVLERMVAAIAPRPGETLVEIGPGPGSLTRLLLERVGRLHAVELDRDLIEPLRRACSGVGELHVHQADALATDFLAFRTADEPLRLVGNLPYNISTPLLFHLGGYGNAVHDMHFLLQREVVARMAAAPGTRAYGRLSVMIQYRYRVEPLFDVAPQAFHPAPKVTSSFVRLLPHETPPVAVRDVDALARLVTRAFSARRKTLRNALKGLLDESAITTAGIDPRRRPDTLSLAEFARLAEAVPDGDGALR